MSSKVWNRSNKIHNEEYHGTMYTIPAGSYIEMDESSAKNFVGQYFSGTNQKKLEVVHDPEEFAAKRDQPVQFTSSIGNRSFRTKEGLLNYESSIEAGIDLPEIEVKSKPKFIYQLTGQEFDSQKDLDAFIKKEGISNGKRQKSRVSG